MALQEAQVAQREATTAQDAATQALNNLSSKIDGLMGGVQDNTQAAEDNVQATQDNTDAVDTPRKSVADLMAKGYKKDSWLATDGFADGGPINGPGTSRQDNIPIWASSGEFMQPANAVKAYGADLMERIRKIQIEPSLLRAAVMQPRSIAGATAVSQQSLQPVMFQFRDAMIAAQAQPDAVQRFATAMNILSLKQGK